MEFNFFIIFFFFFAQERKQKSADELVEMQELTTKTQGRIEEVIIVLLNYKCVVILTENFQDLLKHVQEKDLKLLQQPLVLTTKLATFALPSTFL